MPPPPDPQPGPSATFTPTPEASEALGPDQLQSMLTQVLESIASLQRPQPSASSHRHSEHQDYAYSIASDQSSHDADSYSDVEEPWEPPLSEDEDSHQEPSPFVGLFDPTLFKSILSKATAASQIVPEQEPQPAIPPASHRIHCFLNPW